jgi:hypothetical protein
MALLSLGLFAACAAAQPYTLEHVTIDNGGGTLSGGVWTLSATVGQHDAAVLAGPTYTLEGGFWNATLAPCRADMNFDGILDFFDVQSFLAAYAAGLPAANFVRDELFDFFDVQAFLAAYAAGCP